MQIQHQLGRQRLIPRSRGGRRLRIIALATSRVVAAPSIWEEVIASSIRELSRYRSRVERVVTASGATTLAPAFLSIS